MNDIDVYQKAEADIQSQLTLTVVRKQLSQMSIDCESSPRTPKDGVFDPFAPGPDDKMPRGVPHSSKYTNEFKNTVVRRLNFHHHHHPPPQEVSDEDILATMHENLVQLIVSKQAEEAQFGDDDDCRTPSSPFMRFSVADTCPGAPLKLKPPTKAGIIQLDLCKKLDF